MPPGRRVRPARGVPGAPGSTDPGRGRARALARLPDREPLTGSKQCILKALTASSTGDRATRTNLDIDGDRVMAWERDPGWSGARDEVAPGGVAGSRRSRQRPGAGVRRD